jgi:transcriptional accessory protein Tex/SPT6
LQGELKKEFGKDLWDKAMNMKRSLKSIEDLYWWYKKQVKEATTKSEIDIQLKRANTKGLEYLLKTI